MRRAGQSPLNHVPGRTGNLFPFGALTACGTELQTGKLQALACRLPRRVDRKYVSFRTPSACGEDHQPSEASGSASDFPRRAERTGNLFPFGRLPRVAQSLPPTSPQALVCGLDRKSVSFRGACLVWLGVPSLAGLQAPKAVQAGNIFPFGSPTHAAGTYGSGEPLSLIRACSHDSVGWARPRSEISLSVSR